MDLFSRKLKLQEALHYHSILDNGGIDTDVLLVHQALKHQSSDDGFSTPYETFKQNLTSNAPPVAKSPSDDIVITDNDSQEPTPGAE